MCRRVEHSRIGGMATYRIASPDSGSDGRFEVDIVGIDGVRQTKLGFLTEADAQAWIAEDQRTGASDKPGGFRMRWQF